MGMREWAIAVALGAGLVGCGPPPLEGPPEIESTSEDGRSILVFWLKSHDKRLDGSQTLCLEALAKGKTVGFDLVLEKWHENPPGYNPFTTYDCTGTVKSQGAASDAFIQFLVPGAADAGVTVGMKESVDTQVVALFDPPGQFERGKVRIVLALSLDETHQGAGDLQVDIEAPSSRVRIWNANPAVRRALAKAIGDA